MMDDYSKETEPPSAERREMLVRGVKALAAIGVTGAAVGLAARGALAGSCTDCEGKKHSCDGTPACGIR